MCAWNRFIESLCEHCVADVRIVERSLGLPGAGTCLEVAPRSIFAFPPPQLGGGMEPVVLVGSRGLCADFVLTREARRLRSVVLISRRCGHVRSFGPHVN